MADATPKPLPEVYHDWLTSTIDEDGFEIPHALIMGRDGQLTVAALAVPVPEAYKVVLSIMQETRSSEAIFALDRYTKPGHGTTLGDVMAGHYLADGTTRPFIVEYQFEPRIVKPIEWENPFWNGALRQELGAVLRSIMAGAD